MGRDLLQVCTVAGNVQPAATLVARRMVAGSTAEAFFRRCQTHPVMHLSELFTSPLATGPPFSWKDYTPIAVMRGTNSCSG